MVQYKPVTVYSNGSGTTGTISLSQSAANYTHCRITYKNSDGQYGSTTICGISNANCTTYGTVIRRTNNGDTFMANSALYTISNTTITPSRNYQTNMKHNGATNTWDANYLSIVKVELWS